MLIYKQENIFETDAEAIVNAVNCVGVMGRGIALQFKEIYPDNYKVYREACHRGEVVPGKMFVYYTGKLTNPRYIINFPTKRHWKGKSRIEDIESGLVDLRKQILDLKIKSIAIPPLGSGLGGLDWHQVKSIIINHLADLEEIDIYVYEPIPDNE